MVDRRSRHWVYLIVVLMWRGVSAWIPPLVRRRQRGGGASRSFQRTFHLSAKLEDSGYTRPVVQWYPGHIAKAERQLSETMKAVDVVVEVRDARASKATSHPMVATWCAGRPRIVVLTHQDQIPPKAKEAWMQAYLQYGASHPDQHVNRQVWNQAQQAAAERSKYSSSNNNPKPSTKSTTAGQVAAVLYVDAKTGAGVPALLRQIFKATEHVQERRRRRGLKERPLRIGLMGYPNVGKSALINRLLGRKRAKTANLPGVTRSLQWIRVRSDNDASSQQQRTNKEFELLDSPGVIPATLVDQSDAILLAACNCIGEAAYDNQAVAAFLCEWLLALHRRGHADVSAPDWRRKVMERYQLDPLSDKQLSDGTTRPRTGEDMLFDVADATCRGDPEDAARKILQDFRTGRLGKICLQVAPETSADGGQQAILEDNAEEQERQGKRQEALREQEEKVMAARQVAKERGLKLPPIVNDQDKNVDSNEVGKGLFEGW